MASEIKRGDIAGVVADVPLLPLWPFRFADEAKRRHEAQAAPSRGEG